MSSVSRSIKRGILFKNMNKQQKKLWSSMKPAEKRDYENTKGKEIKEQILQKHYAMEENS